MKIFFRYQEFFGEWSELVEGVKGNMKEWREDWEEKFPKQVTEKGGVGEKCGIILFVRCDLFWCEILNERWEDTDKVGCPQRELRKRTRQMTLRKYIVLWNVTCNTARLHTWFTCKFYLDHLEHFHLVHLHLVYLLYLRHLNHLDCGYLGQLDSDGGWQLVMAYCNTSYLVHPVNSRFSEVSWLSNVSFFSWSSTWTSPSPPPSPWWSWSILMTDARVEWTAMDPVGQLHLVEPGPTLEFRGEWFVDLFLRHL